LNSWQNVLHGFDVYPPPRDLWCPLIFGQQRSEPCGVAFSLVYTLQPIAVGLADALVLFTFSQRDDFVVFSAGLIDQAFLFLLRLIDLIES
jgi:hypothetical protein